MTQYDNTNRGILFDNDRKESDKHPDMKGTLNINGVDHWFSAWWKESKDGNEFLSLSLGKPKDQQQEQQARQPVQQSAPVRRGNRPSAATTAPAPARRSSGFDDMDDDIPF